MLDIKFIRENKDKVQQNARRKGYEVDVSLLLETDKKRQELLKKAEEFRAERNELAHKAKDGKPDPKDIEKGKKLKAKLSDIENDLNPTEKQFKALLASVPNMAVDDVPDGKSEDDNKSVKEWGDKPNFDFKPKNHWELAEPLDLIDKERAAKVAGSRFAYLKGDLVMLEFALWHFALGVLTDKSILEKIIKDNNLSVSTKPFVPVLPPAMAKTKVYEATGRLNKEEQTYQLAEDDLWLNASAEHTIAPMYLNEILEEAEFPIRYVGYTTAFRREAGTYGKDQEGILRLHQFNKLEMECFNLPENSLEEHKFLIAIQEYLMQQLKLPYRVMMKCAGDIGFPNARGVDLDAWLPGQDRYRETHTADYITDFQSRRMKTRVRRNSGETEFTHTNDATAFSERPLIAILENYQQADGTIVIPEVLQKYMNKEVIGEAGT